MLRFAWSTLRDNSGGALVETALMIGLFAPTMLLGTTELAGLVYASIEVSDAAHAGAAYAAQSYVASSDTALPTQAQVTTAAQNDAPEIASMLAPNTTLSASMATGCNGSAASAGNTVPACAGNTLGYVQVTVQAQVTPLVNFPGLPKSLTLASQATMNLVN